MQILNQSKIVSHAMQNAALRMYVSTSSLEIRHLALYLAAILINQCNICMICFSVFAEACKRRKERRAIEVARHTIAAAAVAAAQRDDVSPIVADMLLLSPTDYKYNVLQHNWFVMSKRNLRFE